MSQSAAYEGLQAALDEDLTDQNLRLILADWYEERGDAAGAACMRWLAANGCYPHRQVWKEREPRPDTFAWTRTENDWRRTIPGYAQRYTLNHLPTPVWARLKAHSADGRLYKNDAGWWWEDCPSRREAEEAAVEAWREWLESEENKK